MLVRIGTSLVAEHQDHSVGTVSSMNVHVGDEELYHIKTAPARDIGVACRCCLGDSHDGLRNRRAGGDRWHEVTKRETADRPAVAIDIND